jgi:hypothetical protein
MDGGGQAAALRHRGWWIAAAAVPVLALLTLVWMDRPLLGPSGDVRLWAGEVQGPDNSQHLSDWYTPSHFIHGLLFYAAGWWLLRDRPIALRFALALAVEAAWEIAENTPMVIDRYREATMAFGYSGDSIVNSLADIGWMAAGFWAARVLPWRASLAIGLGFELLTLWAVRDNLTLNVLMLVWPIDAIRIWQAGG